MRRATIVLLILPTRRPDFYPRSPCGERLNCSRKGFAILYFYPRSPCGERRVHFDNFNLHCVISIHALLAESDVLQRDKQPRQQAISIHALLAESDSICQAPILPRNAFLSTLSLRRATIFAVRPYDAPIFLSTLSLRRATHFLCTSKINMSNFYPRSPCGERLADTREMKAIADISIHALLAESDCSSR